MRIRQEKSGLLIVNLSRGESIRENVERLCEERGIHGARVEAIGGVEDPDLGCYELPDKKYLRRSFPGIWELLSLQGNIALKDGKPFLHAHVSLSGPDFMAFGGHLFDAKVGLVVEMCLSPLEAIERKLDETIGLACWDL